MNWLCTPGWHIGGPGGGAEEDLFERGVVEVGAGAAEWGLSMPSMSTRTWPVRP